MSGSKRVEVFEGVAQEPEPVFTMAELEPFKQQLTDALNQRDAEIAKLQASLQKLEEVDSERADAVENLVATKQRLEKDNVKLARDFEKFKAHYVQLETESEGHEQSIKRLKADIVHVNNELKACLNASKTKASPVAKTLGAVDKLELQCKMQDDHIIELNKQIYALEHKLRLQKMVTENEKLKQEVATGLVQEKDMRLQIAQKDYDKLLRNYHTYETHLFDLFDTTDISPDNLQQLIREEYQVRHAQNVAQEQMLDGLEKELQLAQNANKLLLVQNERLGRELNALTNKSLVEMVNERVVGPALGTLGRLATGIANSTRGLSKNTIGGTRRRHRVHKHGRRTHHRR